MANNTRKIERFIITQINPSDIHQLVNLTAWCRAVNVFPEIHCIAFP